MAVTSFGATPNTLANSVATFAAQSRVEPAKAVEWLTLIPLLLEILPTLLGGCKKNSIASALREARSEEMGRVVIGQHIRRALNAAEKDLELNGVKLNKPAARAALLEFVDACDDGQIDELAAKVAPPEFVDAWS